MRLRILAGADGYGVLVVDRLGQDPAWSGELASLRSQLPHMGVIGISGSVEIDNGHRGVAPPEPPGVDDRPPVASMPVTPGTGDVILPPSSAALVQAVLDAACVVSGEVNGTPPGVSGTSVTALAEAWEALNSGFPHLRLTGLRP